MKRTPDDPLKARNDLARKHVAAMLEHLGGETLDAVANSTGRRAAPLRAPLESRALQLYRDSSGLLRWHIGTMPAASPGVAAINASRRQRAGLRRAPLAAPVALNQSLFQALEPSLVGKTLKLADQKLTRPAWNERGQLWGLRRLNASGKLVAFGPNETPKLKGKRILLFVHGTFSNNDAVLGEIAAAPGGKGMLDAALSGKSYDFVLAFDHATLSVSPALNAFDLASRFANGLPASIDIVSHSRGGLVVRWLCEGFRHPDIRYRALLVGSPLAGTSLASPARAKAVMDLLANVGDAVSTVTALGGGIFLSLASTLASIFARVTGALATPLADAVVALIPGLAAQSREGNNAELISLRANTGLFDFDAPDSPVRYAVIRSNFEPSSGGVWSFLKTFVTRPVLTTFDTGADFIFQGNNDLVVDCDSMDQTSELDGQFKRIRDIAHDFGTSKIVYHTNYFSQRETISAVRKTFGF